MFDGGQLSTSYFQTDLASFLVWRDRGFSDKNVFNGFGMSALLGNDGAFVLGEMAGALPMRDAFRLEHARRQRRQSGALEM